MILVDQANHNAVVSNVESSGAFQIKASAKAFTILSASLYKRSIPAIVRELCSNAQDSHRAAGKEKVPFEIFVPVDVIEPRFQISDFGIGMTHEQVMTLYTTYFDSTKTTSNEFVGALGLGSKSPFSYTDNFVVIATKDGERNTYSTFINEHGVPSIARLGSEQTTEGDGVTVEFALKDSNDYALFRDAVIDATRFFEVQPKCNIVLHSFFKTGATRVGDLDAWFYGQDKSKGSAVFILMGGVLYPIDQSIESKNYKELHKGKNAILGALIIEVPIGSIDPLPSREGIQHTQKSIKEIDTRCGEILDFYAEKYRNLYNSLETDYERGKQYHKSRNEVECVAMFGAIFKPKNRAAVSTKPLAEVGAVRTFWKNFNHTIKCRPTLPDSIDLFESIDHRIFYSTEKKPVSDTKIVDSIKRMYPTLDPDTWSNHINVHILYVNDAGNFDPKALSASMGGVPVMPISELLKNCTPKSANQVKLCDVTRSPHSSRYSFVPNSNIDIKKKKYFVEIYINAINLSSKSNNTRPSVKYLRSLFMSDTNLYSFVKLLGSLGINPSEVVAVPRSAKLPKDHGLINVFDLLDKEYNKVFDLINESSDIEKLLWVGIHSENTSVRTASESMVVLGDNISSKPLFDLIHDPDIHHVRSFVIGRQSLSDFQKNLAKDIVMNRNLKIENTAPDVASRYSVLNFNKLVGSISAQKKIVELMNVVYNQTLRQE